MLNVYIGKMMAQWLALVPFNKRVIVLHCIFRMGQMQTLSADKEQLIIYAAKLYSLC